MPVTASRSLTGASSHALPRIHPSSPIGFLGEFPENLSPGRPLPAAHIGEATTQGGNIPLLAPGPLADNPTGFEPKDLRLLEKAYSDGAIALLGLPLTNENERRYRFTPGALVMDEYPRKSLCRPGWSILTSCWKFARITTAIGCGSLSTWGSVARRLLRCAGIRSGSLTITSMARKVFEALAGSRPCMPPAMSEAPREGRLSFEFRPRSPGTSG